MVVWAASLVAARPDLKRSVLLLRTVDLFVETRRLMLERLATEVLDVTPLVLATADLKLLLLSPLIAKVNTP